MMPPLDQNALMRNSDMTHSLTLAYEGPPCDDLTNSSRGEPIHPLVSRPPPFPLFYSFLSPLFFLNIAPRITPWERRMIGVFFFRLSFFPCFANVNLPWLSPFVFVGRFTTSFGRVAIIKQEDSLARAARLFFVRTHGGRVRSLRFPSYSSYPGDRRGEQPSSHN